MVDALDLEIEGLSVLDNAKSYDEGVNQLKDYYTSNFDQEGAAHDEEAAKALADYGDQLYYKHKQQQEDPIDMLQIAPIKADEVQGKDTVDKINNWETANTEYLDQSTDPDVILTRENQKRQIKTFASDARRDEKSDYGSNSLWADTVEKVPRVLEGAVGSIGSLFGNDDVGNFFREYTKPEDDSTLASSLASGAGTLIPAMIAEVATGGGTTPILVAQTLGSTRAAYNRFMKQTGNEETSLTGAQIEFAGQAAGFIPLGRAVSKLGAPAEKTISSEIGKVIAADGVLGIGKKVGISAAEGVVGGAVGAVASNIGAAVGSNTDVDISEGVAQAAISNAILGGSVSGVHALISDVKIHQFNKVIDEAHAQAKRAANKVTPENINDPLSKIEQSPDRTPEQTAARERKVVREKDDMSPFKQDETGNFVESKDESRNDFEKRVDDYDKIANEVDAVEKDPIDPMSQPTDEEGKPVVFETGENTIVDEADFLGEPNDSDVNDLSLGGKIILSNEPWVIKPSRFLTYFAKKILGSSVNLRRNIADGALGMNVSRRKPEIDPVTGKPTGKSTLVPFVDPKTGEVSNTKIEVLRSLGADPDKLAETLAHEIGHALDGTINNQDYLSEALKVLAQKVAGVKGATNTLAKKFPAQARDISKIWRGGWDGTNDNVYRSRNREVYADLFSAIGNAPEWVRGKYPEMMQAFEDHLAQNPIVAEAWKEFKRFENDPDAIAEFDSKVRREARQQQGTIAAAAEAAKVKTLGDRFKQRRDEMYQYVFDRYAPAKEVLNRLPPEVRGQGYDILNNLTRKDYVAQFIHKFIDEPLREVASTVQQNKIDFNDWAQYLWSDRVINETTRTIEDIKQDPEKFRQLVPLIRGFLATEKGVHPAIVEGIFHPDKIATTEGLIQAFASIDIAGDTASLITRQDFESRYELTDPNRDRKIASAMARARDSLAKRDVSIPIENFNKFIDGLPNDAPEKALLEQIANKGSFAVRKYLVNSGGTTIFDAKRDFEYVKKKLGAEKAKILEEQSSKYHQILAKALPIIQESHIFSPELNDRLALNKDNYVTANVLKYFEGDDSINAGMRQSIGSLSDIGNELNSTSLKVKALIERAYYQRANNAAVDIAKATGMVAEAIKPKYGTNIFDQKTLLSLKDKDHSYLIGYKQGKPTLYKITGGKGFEMMFQNIRDIPVVGFVMDLTQAFNNIFLTRQLKTTLSPAFIFNQKRIDRKWEAMMAHSVGAVGFGDLTIGSAPRAIGSFFGLPVHAQEKLRAMDTQTLAEIAHYTKTGELTGNLKKIIDLDGAALELHYGDLGEFADTHSFERASYEQFGQSFEAPEAATATGRLVQHTAKFAEKVSKTVEGTWLGTAAKKMTDYANVDELRTKVNGFAIGKEAGMTDKQAAAFAREKFGNPDPLAGGIVSPAISSLFLFGRAHANGLRNLKDYIKDNPKSAAFNGSLAMASKLMGSAFIMQAALKTVFGDDTADKYKKMIDMIPENEWITKDIVPLGFVDSKGAIRMFHDVKSADITPDWKAFYTRKPQAHETTSMVRVMWPLFKQLGQGNVSGAVEGVGAASKDIFGANLQPIITYVAGLYSVVTGGNPTDSFRGKPILNKETVESGSLPTKLGAYGKYVASQQFGSVVPYNPFKTTESKGVEKGLNIPLVGPMARSFIGINNYGNAEKNNAIEAELNQEKARIRLSVDDTTTGLLDQYRIAKAQTTSLGKGWQTKVPLDTAKHISALTSWNTKVWRPYQQELLAAKSAGDSERYSELLSSLGKYSQQVKGLLGKIELSEDNVDNQAVKKP